MEFTLGADPEFLFVDSNGSVKAANYIIKENEYEEEATEEFGVDGAGTPAEIRPSPEKCPIKLFSNIHKILLNGLIENPSCKNYKWLALPNYNRNPVGGHIHFGIRETKDFVNILDANLGLLSFCLENKEQGERRRGYDYGNLSDTRNTSYGFEYRCLSTWLGSPKVTLSVLCLAKILGDEYHLNRQKQIETADSILTKYNNDDVILTHNIIQNIKSMASYKKYQNYIDFLFYLVKNKLSWHTKVDMKETWGLNNIEFYKKPKEKPQKIALDSIWKGVLS